MTVIINPRELDEWYALTQELPGKIAREKELRQKIFDAAFAEPKLGVNRFNLGHGKDLKGTYNLSYGVDRVALEAFDSTAVTSEVFYSVIKFKPEVSQGGWNKLTDDQRKLFGNVVTVKPALPAMEITNVKQRG